MGRFSRRKRKVTKTLKQIKVIWIIKGILYGLGIVSFFYCQKEYTSILISFKAVVISGIITGLIVSLIVERQLKYYLFSIILFGSLCLAIFFRVNRSLVHPREEKIKVRILAKMLRSAKTEHSQVTIDYNDFTRDIYIDGEQEHSIGPAQFIILTVRKGGLGYYIITYRELTSE